MDTRLPGWITQLLKELQLYEITHWKSSACSLLAGFNRRQEDKTLYIGFIIMDSLYKDPQTPKFLAGSLNCCKSCNRDLVGTTQLSASGSQKKSKEL